MTYDQFKEAIAALYAANGTINIAAGKLNTQITIEHMFDQGADFEISDDSNTSIIFDSCCISDINKSNDGIGDIYTITQDNIKYIISVI